MEPISRIAPPTKAESLTGNAAPSAPTLGNPLGNPLAPNLGWGTAPRRAVPRLPKAPQAARSTVLSVDDNDDLRRVMELTLGVLGFNVISCPDAEAASRAYRASAHIDLLVTDLEMPGRSGIELAQEICALCPAMPVLIVSGAYFSTEIQQQVEQGEWRFLAKPYAVPEFSANIHDLLRIGSARRQGNSAGLTR